MAWAVEDPRRRYLQQLKDDLVIAATHLEGQPAPVPVVTVSDVRAHGGQDMRITFGTISLTHHYTLLVVKSILVYLHVCLALGRDGSPPRGLLQCLLDLVGVSEVYDRSGERTPEALRMF